MFDIIEKMWKTLGLQTFRFLAETEEMTAQVEQYFVDNGGHADWWNEFTPEDGNRFWKYRYARGIGDRFDHFKSEGMPKFLQVSNFLDHELTVPGLCQVYIEDIDLDTDAERFSIGFDCYRFEGYFAHGGMFVVFQYSEQPDMIYIFPNRAQEFLAATALCFDEWIKSESDEAYSLLGKTSPTQTLLVMSLSVSVDK